MSQHSVRRDLLVTEGSSLAKPPPDAEVAKPPQKSFGARLKRVLYENSLSLVVVTAFLLFWGGQAVTGWFEYNDEEKSHGQPQVGFHEYLGTGHFLEATAENWESEFLQMGFFVLLTVWLRQKGSAESRKLEGFEDQDRDPRLARNNPDAPWPVKRGGIVLRLYSHSLTIVFLLMFLVAFFLHALGGAREYSSEQIEHGEPGVTVWQYLGTSRFWFESFQNWQSEFLAILAMVVLSIWLREKGSTESKPVDAPYSQTGK